MKCRSCGLEIAEKAIVCYRCGTPTAVAAPVPPAPVRDSSHLWAVGIVLAVVALTLWLVHVVIPGTGARWTAWAVVLVAGAVAVRLLAARRRAGGSRR